MTLFPEWQEKHKDAHPQLPERIRAAHRFYGLMPGKTCRTCKHLLRFKQSARWMKCELSKISGGAGTDWRAGWPACGKYEEEKPDAENQNPSQ